MAVNNYSVSFQSLRSNPAKTYTVNIVGGSGAAVALTPAPHPFVTEEDTDEDVFVPVRKHSGYIRIVDPCDGSFNWKDLVPLTDVARPVTLTQGGVVLWQGFMQSQNFSGTLYGGVQEREFPIQCPLASVGTQDIVLATAAVTEMKNFAYYLKSIIDYIVSVGGGMIGFDNVYVQGGTAARNTLLYLIDPQAFVSLDLDENIFECNHSKYSVLEDICRYWGFTARTYGRDIYLMQTNGDTSDFVKLSMTDLATMAGGTTAGTTVSMQSPATLGNVFASMDNDITVERGYSKATVKGDAGDSEKSILDCFPKYVKNLIENSGNVPDNERVGDEFATYYGKLSSFSSIDMVGASTGYSSFRTGQVYTLGNFNADGEHISMLHIMDPYSEGTAKLSIETVYERNFAGMVFSLKGDTYLAGKRLDFTSNDFDHGNHVMICRMGIGKTRQTAKWFNGESWQSSQTTFNVSIGNKGSVLYVRQAGTTAQYYYADKFAVPFNNGYYGKLFIDFMGTSEKTYEDHSAYTYNFMITNFSIDMEYGVSNNTYTSTIDTGWDSSTKEMFALNSSDVLEKWNADCMFCSYGGVKYGHNILAESGGVPSRDSHEQNLANRVAAGTGTKLGYWRTSKLMYRTELLANDNQVAGISPQKELMVDSVHCMPIAIGRDWCDDVVMITFIQK